MVAWLGAIFTVMDLDLMWLANNRSYAPNELTIPFVIMGLAILSAGCWFLMLLHLLHDGRR